MIIKRQKLFGFFSAITGNKELRKSMLEYYKVQPDSQVISDFNKIHNKDFLKFLTWLYENKKSGRTSFDTETSKIQIILFSYESALKCYNDKKTPSGIQNYNDGRIVLFQTALSNGSDEHYVVSFLPNKNKYEITRESSSSNFISRGINSLFGNKGKQLIDEFNSVIDCYDFLDKSLRRF